MKILEAQNAVLTNYEVYKHLTEQRERYAQDKRRGPPNLETVVREVSLKTFFYLSGFTTSLLPIAELCGLKKNGKGGRKENF